MTTKDFLAIQLSTVSSGSLISWNGSAITSISSTNVGTAFTAGTGLSLVGSQFAIDNSVVATISGSVFTGPVRFNQGLSGSLTKLTNGSSFLVEGSNISITSASNGAVTISSPIKNFDAVKSLDENRTGDTVSTDTDLTITLNDSGLYSLDAEIHFTANMGVGIKYRFFATSGTATVTWHNTFVPPITLISGVNEANTNGAGAIRGISVRGAIEVTSAPAVISLQWSQTVNDLLNPTTLHKGSWIKVSKL